MDAIKTSAKFTSVIELVRRGHVEMAVSLMEELPNVGPLMATAKARVVMADEPAIYSAHVECCLTPEYIASYNARVSELWDKHHALVGDQRLGGRFVKERRQLMISSARRARELWQADHLNLDAAIEAEVKVGEQCALYFVMKDKYE